ncbi:Putative protein of unknown function [Podospora comata]|uniref:Uncharacterized protein n=1 Tax=Podospora comata TaxID=48703 RepID=A0ABY6RTS0_PODCO|nr:Putative protein of unknown function [Podospora comata]
MMRWAKIQQGACGVASLAWMKPFDDSCQFCQLGVANPIPMDP